MNDQEVDAYISRRLREKGIEWGHFISGRVYIDQILTEGEYDQFNPYSNLAVSIPDLVRYWWNRHTDRYGFINDVLEDLWIDFKDRAAPRQEPVEPEPDYSDAFDEIFKEAV
jgi:hypothetical protein